MKAYLAYKQWWIDNVAPAEFPSEYFGDTPEQAFKQHVNDLGLYNLMETLCTWVLE
jgi:hypothetical protein